MSSMENLSPSVLGRLMKEVRGLYKNPIDGIDVHVEEDNISNIFADIHGPVGTPFEGGVFRIKLVLTSDFPQSPPKGYFLTRIFHPNVSLTGEICVNTLKKDWKADHGIKHILMVVRCLLIVPNPESALNPEAGKLLLEDYDDYASRATLMTRIHAKPKSTSSASSSSSSSKKKTIEVKTGSSSSSSSSSKKLKGKKKKTKTNKKKSSLRRL